jgi:hypothetical protein
VTNRYLNRKSSNTKLEIGQNGIGNEIYKEQKRVAYYVNYKRKKKKVVNKNYQSNALFIYIYL